MTDDFKIDLHTHSHYSDGELTPEELMASAAKAGINAIALTDHDTIAGLDRAQSAARHLGLKLIAGVEVSVAWRAQSIHLVGLWIDPSDRTLVGHLEGQAELRRERIQQMCAKLTKQRLPGDKLLATLEAHGGILTRTHLAQAMVAEGCVSATDDAFRKYLAKGKPGHVASDWPALALGIEWIVKAGGIATLAHPSRYALSGGARQRLLEEFKAAGGEGIEVVSGGNGAHHTEGCAAMARKHALLGSVGSDFHSPRFAWNPLGRSLKLPDCITPVWHDRLP